MAYALRQELRNNPELNNYVLGKFGRYAFEPGGLKENWWEMFSIYSEAMTQGNITLSKGFLTKITDIFRRVFREFGYNIKIRGPKDIINFIRDFNYEVDRERFSKGMRKIMDEGITNYSKEWMAEM